MFHVSSFILTYFSHAVGSIPQKRTDADLANTLLKYKKMTLDEESSVETPVDVKSKRARSAKSRESAKKKKNPIKDDRGVVHEEVQKLLTYIEEVPEDAGEKSWRTKCLTQLRGSTATTKPQKQWRRLTVATFNPDTLLMATSGISAIDQSVKVIGEGSLQVLKPRENGNTFHTVRSTTPQVVRPSTKQRAARAQTAPYPSEKSNDFFEKTFCTQKNIHPFIPSMKGAGGGGMSSTISIASGVKFHKGALHKTGPVLSPSKKHQSWKDFKQSQKRTSHTQSTPLLSRPNTTPALSTLAPPQNNVFGEKGKDEDPLLNNNRILPSTREGVILPRTLKNTVKKRVPSARLRTPLRPIRSSKSTGSIAVIDSSAPSQKRYQRDFPLPPSGIVHLEENAGNNAWL